MSYRPPKPYRPKIRYDRNSIGDRVQRIRQGLGLTRDELAARAQVKGWDISPYVIRRIEHGDREVTDIELRKLAKVLNVPIVDLFA